MRLPIYQVDAFTDRQFGGNPAAVVLLESWLPDTLLQAIAAENNLSETAFLVPQGERFDLRWFTPAVEVDLCGHATLASGFVVLTRLTPQAEQVQFQTRFAGALTVSRDGSFFLLDFPARPPLAWNEPTDAILSALGGPVPESIWKSRDHLFVYQDEDTVRRLSPDFGRLGQLAHHAYIVTAPGKTVDFVSRFFAPKVGVNEDPVTGSAHCTLIPYWAERLGRETLTARQVSRRGGDLHCRLAGDRVIIGGQAVLFLEGSIEV